MEQQKIGKLTRMALDNMRSNNNLELNEEIEKILNN